MKKTAALLISLSLVLFIFAAAACTFDADKNPEHTHTVQTNEETRGREVFSVKTCAVCGKTLEEDLIARYIAEGLLLDLENTSVIKINSADGLKNFNAVMASEYTPAPDFPSLSKNSFANKTFILETDVDLSEYSWLPTSVDGAVTDMVFDGNNHTVTGLGLSGSTKIGFFGYVSNNLSVKNLNFSKARMTVTGKWCGLLVGQLEGGLLTVENVNFDECETLGTVEPKAIRIGCIVGYCFLGSSSLDIKNCKVENSLFSGYHNTCALVGTLAGAQEYPTKWNISGCNVFDNRFLIGTENPMYVNPFTVDTTYLSREEMENLIISKGNTAENNIFEYGVTENPFTPEYDL